MLAPSPTFACPPQSGPRLGWRSWTAGLVLVLLLCWTPQAPGQAPLLQGWGQPTGQTTNPDNDVRAAIGLAPLPTAAEQGTYAVAPDAATTSGSLQDLQDLTDLVSDQGQQLTSRDGLTSSLKVGLLLAVLSLAPAIALMTTCYVRIIVVLTLLRQAFGGQQLPPMQVMTALSLFLSLLIMAPVWNQVKQEAIDPYTAADSEMTWDEAWQRGVVPVKAFMARQIEACGNQQAIGVFYQHIPGAGAPPTLIDDVPLNVLLPAFVVSELKVAFLLGFQIYLPFLVLDLVVSSVTVSSGMLMLPPTMVSFPLKLILFVLVDGWNLVVGMLLQSFVPFT